MCVKIQYEKSNRTTKPIIEITKKYFFFFAQYLNNANE